ncbi:MAG TPA: hypothetical protein VNE61_03330 [Ktedonobacteraceae bacterium]|nr:hypothetical protein [Ktedonobacteraceae bacterium]
MKPLDDLTSEEQQNEELIMDLHQALNKPVLLSAEEQTKHLARVRERLFASDPATTGSRDLPARLQVIPSREQHDDALLPQEGTPTIPRHRSRFLHTVNMLAAVVVVCALIGSILLIFVYHPASNHLAAPTSPAKVQRRSALVSFAPATPYTQALRTITDIGLRPLPPSCTATMLGTNGKIEVWYAWEPSAKGFSITPAGMYIAPTLLASSDWLIRLRALPGVVNVQTTTFVFLCSLAHNGTPPPDTVVALALQQAGTYLTVAFSQRADTYDQALQTISNLGLRLADPCLERTGKQPPPGYFAGQEQKYAATHTLVLATTANSPNNWQQQLTSLTGKISFQILTSHTC